MCAEYFCRRSEGTAARRGRPIECANSKGSCIHSDKSKLVLNEILSSLFFSRPEPKECDNPHCLGGLPSQQFAV